MIITFDGEQDLQTLHPRLLEHRYEIFQGGYNNVFRGLVETTNNFKNAFDIHHKEIEGKFVIIFAVKSDENGLSVYLLGDKLRMFSKVANKEFDNWIENLDKKTLSLHTAQKILNIL